MDDQKILDKVEGRRFADEVNEYIIESLADKSQEFVDAFWLKMLPPQTEVEIKPARPTMTEEEAMRFERKPILFGIHKDLLHQEVPTGYLLWLSKESEELASYLRSDIGQRRQEEDASSH